jgi:hypothetical protein
MTRASLGPGVKRKGRELPIGRAILTAFLLWSASASTADQPEQVIQTRTGMVADLRAAWEGLDTDRDGLVGRAEWDVMVETSIKIRESDPEPLEDPEQLRRGLRHGFDVDDVDGDGFLTLAEMLALPLETFDCMDRDGSQALTRSESFAGLEACEHLAVKMP